LLEILDRDEKNISANLECSFHKTIKKVSEDIENLKFNTAIAALMSLINEIYASKKITLKELEIFTLLLNPFAPHVTEEVWEQLETGENFASIHVWPEHDEEKCKDKIIEVAVQVNGKVRARLELPAPIQSEEAIKKAKDHERIASEINGKSIVKELYVKGRLVSIVCK